MKKTNISEKFKQQAFIYLDDLRESGQTNMFGAGQYLEAVYGIDRFQAKEILKEWMDTFNERHQKEEAK